MAAETKIAILGTGNIGRAIATGLVDARVFDHEEMILTRRNVARLTAT